MTSKYKKLENSQVEVSVTVDANEMSAIVKSVEANLVNSIDYPGFRKGKVPLTIIRKEFARVRLEEISNRMVRTYLSKAIEENNIKMLNTSEIKDLKVEENAGEFVAVVEVHPEFKLPEYKGLKIEFKPTEATDEMVKEQVESLRLAYATYEDAKEGDIANDGDFVQIDYDGTVGGKPIAEISKEAKSVASRKGFWMHMQEGYFLPEIIAAVKGMKIGETKNDIAVHFPKDSAPEALKDADAIYTVTVTALRHRLTPDDAALAQKAKMDSFDALCEDVRKHLNNHMSQQEENRRKNAALEALLEKVSFEVPPSQVAFVRDQHLKEFASYAQQSGQGADYFEKNRESILKDANERAEKSVRVWYLIDAIAKAENIDVANDNDRGAKVLEILLANAKEK